ncbi:MULTISPECIES: hypothetical protein [Kribbella]
MSDQIDNSTPDSNEPDPPFSLRTTVLMLLALVLGVSIGVLTYLAHQPVAAAIVAGMVAAGAAFAAAHRLVGKG